MEMAQKQQPELNWASKMVGIKAGQTALRHLYSRVADKASQLDKERGQKKRQEKRGKGREEASMSCEETGRGALRGEEML